MPHVKILFALGRVVDQHYRALNHCAGGAGSCWAGGPAAPASVVLLYYWKRDSRKAVMRMFWIRKVCLGVRKEVQNPLVVWSESEGFSLNMPRSLGTTMHARHGHLFKPLTYKLLYINIIFVRYITHIYI